MNSLFHNFEQNIRKGLFNIFNGNNNDNTQNSPSEKVVRRSVFFDDEGGEGDNVIPT
jgi:hypothetical protein